MSDQPPTDGEAHDPLAALHARLAAFTPTARSGHVTSVLGSVIRAVVPDVRIGQIVRIDLGDGHASLMAEVAGFDREDVVLLPLGRITGIPVKAPVVALESTLDVPAGPGMRGRVIDALGNPMDGRGPVDGSVRAPLMASPPNPLKRARIAEPLATGVRVIDALLTVGRGQRVGIFAAAGGGKSTLLGMLARNVAADRVVVALIGERGREVDEFLTDSLGTVGRAKSTVVVSTSDEPALLRARAAHTATAIAEAARANGERVVLMMDSVTRFARALREIGLSIGEPPGRQGYPASVFASLPTLFERAGNDDRGSITAFYTVLVAGDDLEEPVADETISLLDGHIVLSRKLAERQHYPAIDVPRSKSRLADHVTDRAHRDAAGLARRILGLYEQNYDKISLGLYRPQDEVEARLVARIGDVNALAQQRSDEAVSFEETVRQLTQGFSR